MTLRRRILLGVVLSLAVIAAGQRDARPEPPTQPAPRTCTEDEIRSGGRCIHVERVQGSTWEREHGR